MPQCIFRVITPIDVNMNKRQSNMELLRIIAMLLVLVVHANVKSIGAPTLIELEYAPLPSFLRLFSQAMSIVCVNTFILISGWFGIRPKTHRFTEFIFQVLFIGVIIYFVMYTLDLVTAWGVSDWIKLFTFRRGDCLWFVYSYIVLYIFTPILNEFAVNANRQVFKNVLISFFVIQTYLGYIDSYGFFAAGYSPLSFMGLYLLTRYFRLYPSRLTSLSKYHDICIYVSMVFLITISAIAFKIVTGKGISFIFDYSSPLIILASSYFFLFFTKISFYNKAINWIASSSFAVYLFHADPLIFEPYYLDTIRFWHANSTLPIFILQTSGLIISVFSLSILLDKIRLFIWNRLCRIRQ